MLVGRRHLCTLISWHWQLISILLEPRRRFGFNPAMDYIIIILPLGQWECDCDCDWIGLKRWSSRHRRLFLRFVAEKSIDLAKRYIRHHTSSSSCQLIPGSRWLIKALSRWKLLFIVVAWRSCSFYLICPFYGLMKVTSHPAITLSNYATPVTVNIVLIQCFVILLPLHFWFIMSP